MKDFIKIHENDNVIVALKELSGGEAVTVAGKTVTAVETIPAGHKMAITDMPQGVCGVVLFGVCETEDLS